MLTATSRTLQVLNKLFLIFLAITEEYMYTIFTGKMIMKYEITMRLDHMISGVGRFEAFSKSHDL